MYPQQTFESTHIIWKVCAKHPRFKYPPSFIAFTMFDALSDTMMWIFSFFIFHLSNISSNMAQIFSPVCESGNDCTCRTADFLMKASVIQWAVRLIIESSLISELQMSVVKLNDSTLVRLTSIQLFCSTCCGPVFTPRLSGRER